MNWKLSQEGAKGKKSAAGLKLHKETAEHVDALELFQAHARWSIQTSFLLALFAISAASLALEFLFLDVNAPLKYGLVVLSVSWLMGSLYLFLFDLYYRARGEQLIRKYKIEDGDVAYSDSPKQKDILTSKIMPLQGKPDYVVKLNGHYVPVEIKSGKAPRRPYDSHVQQLAAYCYLVNETYGVRPPHGVIAYPEHRFEISYTPALEDQLLKNLLRMQLAERTGEAHRNHESPKRCAGCSRREGCPERLA
jgi:CRISPR-associated exonuclease Cas4